MEVKKIINAIGLGIFFIVSLQYSTVKASPKTISVWSYYKFPPFIVDRKEKKGLSYDFMGLLNEYGGDKYQFHFKILPRKRLDMRMAEGEQGIVLWVNPLWFGDKEKKMYLWTEVLLKDQHEIISRVENPVDFNGVESLKGLKLGGMRGHKYIGIDEAIEKGDIKLRDLSNETQGIGMLLEKRIDFTLMPRTTILYFSKKMGLEGKIYLSPTPLNTYTRHILIHKQLEDVEQFLSGIVATLPHNQKWKSIKQKYGL